ncbi:MAG: hypothetical protein ACJA1F_002124 [Paracoccaceae bacterium]
MGGFPDPESQSGTVDINALPCIDPALAVQRQVVGVFGDDHARDSRLGRQAAFDQAQLCGRLDDASLARAACILGSACGDDTELRRYDIQPLTDVFEREVELICPLGRLLRNRLPVNKWPFSDFAP